MKPIKLNSTIISALVSLQPKDASTWKWTELNYCAVPKYSPDVYDDSSYMGKHWLQWA